MLVRMMILLLATAALAQPRLSVSAPTSNSVTARLVLVDSSWSMHRRSHEESALFDSALRAARGIADSAAITRVVVTTSPSLELPAAVAWLNETDAATRELVLVSDFQTGTIDSATIARLANGIGFRTVRISNGSAIQPRVSARLGDASIVTDFELTENGTLVRYSFATLYSGHSFRAAIPAADSSTARLLRTVASSVALPIEDAADVRDSTEATQNAVALYTRDGTGWASARKRALPLASSAQAAMVLQLANDSRLLEIARTSGVNDDTAPDTASTAFIEVARSSNGEMIVDAARDSSGAGSTLMVFVHDDLLSPLSAAVFAALEQSEALFASPSERDPTTISDDGLQALNRPAVAQSTALDDRQVGRWVWVLVLVAMGVEWAMRRGRRLVDDTGAAA
jgi:hypothetical protein